MKKSSGLLALLLSGFLLVGITDSWAGPVSRRLYFTKATNLAAGTTYTFRFSLWNNLSGGTPADNKVWEEEKALTVNGENIITYLGTNTPIGDLSFAEQYWVEVEKLEDDGVTFTPLGVRTKLNVVPYALWSETAAAGGSVNSVSAGGGLTATGATGDITLEVGAGAGISVTADTVAIAAGGVSAEMLATNAVTNTKLAANAVGTVKIAAGAVTAAKINPAGLSADMVDSKHAADFAPAIHPHAGGDITSGTVLEAFIDQTLARDSEVFDAIFTHNHDSAYVRLSSGYTDPPWLWSLAGDKIQGDISGNAGNVTGIVAVANGGTGAAEPATALTNLGAASLTAPNTFTQGQKILTGNDGKQGLIIKANSATQSAKLQEWQDQNGAMLAGVTSAGQFLGSFVGDGASLFNINPESHNHDVRYVNEEQPNSISGFMILDNAVSDRNITGPISGYKINSLGLGADLLDGKHASDFPSLTHAHDDRYPMLLGLYPDPVWLTSLSWSKITDVAVNAADIHGLQGGGVAFGSIDGLISDNTKFYWDNSNKRLGLGTTSPNEQLTLSQNLSLPKTTSTTGQIKVSTNRFLHSYGTNNTFLGAAAGNFTSTGLGRNTGVGSTALYSIDTGIENTATGYSSLRFNTEGNDNTAAGYDSLYANTKGSSNTALGSGNLGSNTTASRNTAIGAEALLSQFFSNGDLAWNSDNTAIGYAALRYNAPNATTNGINNTAVGVDTLLLNARGSNNTALGKEAGRGNQYGSGNLFLGFGAGYSETGSNRLHIANSSSATLIYGQFDTSMVGINTTAPTKTLDVNGSLRVRNLSGTAATTVCRDANGVLAGCSSDARLKREVVTLSEQMDVLAALAQLRGVTFYWDTANAKARDLGTQQELGLIAQEVEAVLPEVVGTNPDGYKYLEYAKLTAFLIEVNKAQQTQIQAQAERLTQLEQKIQEIQAGSGEID